MTRSVAMMQTTASWISASKRSTCPGIRSRTTTNSKQARCRFSSVFCRRLSSLSAHTCPSHASEEMSCAERIGFLWEGLQVASVRSFRIEKSPPTQSAASAYRPAQGSAPRRAGPCRHRSQSTNFVGNRQRASKTVFDRSGKATNSTHTLCRSSRGSCSRSLSLPTVRISFVHPSEDIFCAADWLSLRGIAGAECDILPIWTIANH